MEIYKYSASHFMTTDADETCIFMTGHHGGIVKEMMTGKTQNRLQDTGNSCSALSLDGRYIAFNGAHGKLRIFTASTSPMLVLKKNLHGPFLYEGVVFSPDSESVLVGVQNKILRISIDSGEETLFLQLPAHHFCSGISVHDERILILSQSQLNATEKSFALLYRFIEDGNPTKIPFESLKPLVVRRGALLPQDQVFFHDLYDGMRIYTIENDDKHGEQSYPIMLPKYEGTLHDTCPVFSPCMRYFSRILSVKMIPHKKKTEINIECIAELYETNTWKVVATVTAEAVGRPSFSSKGNYWLIPAKKSLSIPIASLTDDI